MSDWLRDFLPDKWLEKTPIYLLAILGGLGLGQFNPPYAGIYALIAVFLVFLCIEAISGS